MLIKASIRSSKSNKTASGAVDYILSNLDHEGKERAVKPKILFGDAELVKSYDKHPNNTKKNKSTSGVIALRDDEKLDDKQKQKLVDRFIELAIPENYRNKVDLLVVEHQEKGNQELHFVIPHLTADGERFNPFPVVGRDRGLNSFEAVKAMTRLLNDEFHFQQVVENDNKHGLSPKEFKHAKYINTKTEAGKKLLTEEKETFNKHIEKVIKHFDFDNRDQLVDQLKKNSGYKTIKTYDNRITFTLKNNRKLTMYGGVFTKQSEKYYTDLKANNFLETAAVNQYTQADKARDLNIIDKWHKVLEAKFNPELTSKQQNQEAFKVLNEFKQAAQITISTNTIKVNKKSTVAPKQSQEPQQTDNDNNIGAMAISSPGGTASAIDIGSAESAVNSAMSALKEAEAKHGPNSVQAKLAKAQLRQAQKALAAAQEAKAKEQDKQRKNYKPMKFK